jgi:transposase
MGKLAPRVIGIDEVSIRKRHVYRIVGSRRLLRGLPIWFGVEDRSEESMKQFYDWLGEKKARRIRLAVMDMWNPFCLLTAKAALQDAILFHKLHIVRQLREALDAVRKSEYARLKGQDRRFIKGQKCTVPCRRENLSLQGRQARSGCWLPTSGSTPPISSRSPPTVNPRTRPPSLLARG